MTPLPTNKITIEGYRWATKNSSSVLVIKARDQMKRPVAISIDAAMTDGDRGAPAMEGDKGACWGILNGLAEIAWASGWRPKGLEAVVAKAVADHKSPVKKMELL